MTGKCIFQKTKISLLINQIKKKNTQINPKKAEEIIRTKRSNRKFMYERQKKLKAGPWGALINNK